MGSRWTMHETDILITHYHDSTIDELMERLPNKTQEAINNKIKRLKKAGKLVGEKTEDAVKRAYEQRSRK